MQKKSLLVALFCGALCLTGCLKNEESASVEQVRIAKANELNSLATLNAAKAQAEVIYANAEATLKQAQAALLNAQAETEKIRAELLKVQVKIGEVKVEEEKVELQKKQAELEVLLAQAEAGKQAWVNVLNKLLADAQVQALENEQAILDAIAKFENNTADSARVYAGKYYGALQEVQALELQQLAIKAEKALVKAGVKAAKKSINFELEQIENQIAENEGIIAVLKEKQSMTPEEAKEALKDARVALSEAYTAYQEAVQDKAAANEVYTNLSTMKADFTQGWSSAFKNDFKGIVALSGDYYYGHKTIAELEVPGHSGNVTYSGVYVYDDDDDDENDVFIPLWTSKADNAKWARAIPVDERYPDIDVYNNGDFTTLTTTVYAPAVIDFEAVDDVLDDLAEETEGYYAAKVKKYEEKTVPAEIAALNAQKTELEKSLALHKEYVAKRQADITKAEEDFIAEFKANKGKKEAVETAWEDFQKHMLLNHDVDRQLFLNQDAAQKAYDKAVSDANTAANDLAAAKTAATDAEATLKTARENEAKAEGDYNKAVNTDAATEKAALDAAVDAWDPEYKVEYNADGSVKSIEHEGSTQKTLREAKDDLEDAKETEYAMQMEYWRHPKGATGYDTAKANYDQAVKDREDAEEAVDNAQTALEKAEKKYHNAKADYDEAKGTALETAEAAWNPEVGSMKGVTTTTGFTYDKTKKVWKKADKVAGTSQAAVLDAIDDLAAKEAELKAGTGDKAGKTAFDKDAKAKSDKTTKKTELDNANKALIAAVKGVAVSAVDLTKDKIEDYLDAEGIKLYNTYKTAKDAAATNTAKAALMKLYAYNPNHIGEWNELGIDDIWAGTDDAQYSWWKSSYSVDYTAKMVDLETAEYYFIATALNGPKMKDGKAVTTKLENGQEIVVPKNFNGSPSYQIAAIEEEIAAKPEDIAAYKAEAAEDLAEELEDIEEVRANVKAFQAHEAGYTAWLDELSEAEEAVNEATKVEFDAKVVKDLAAATFKAIDAIANEGMYMFVGGANDVDKEASYRWFKLQDAIEYLEGTSAVLNQCVAGLVAVADLSISVNFEDGIATNHAKISAIANALQQYAVQYGRSIVGLNVVKKLLEKVLEYGDVAESTVLEMLDERLQWNEERIAILNAIAEKYKTVLYAYLGVDEEEVAAAE